MREEEKESEGKEGERGSWREGEGERVREAEVCSDPVGFQFQVPAQLSLCVDFHVIFL